MVSCRDLESQRKLVEELKIKMSQEVCINYKGQVIMSIFKTLTFVCMLMYYTYLVPYMSLSSSSILLDHCGSTSLVLLQRRATPFNSTLKAASHLRQSWGRCNDINWCPLMG